MYTFGETYLPLFKKIYLHSACYNMKENLTFANSQQTGGIPWLFFIFILFYFILVKTGSDVTKSGMHCHTKLIFIILSLSLRINVTCTCVLNINSAKKMILHVLVFGPGL